MVTQCKPLGYFTVGKGPGRTVHPVCPRGLPLRVIRHRVKKAERYARKHQIPMGEPIKIPRIEAFPTVSPTLRKPKLGKPELKARARQRARTRARKGESGLNARATMQISRLYPTRVMQILEQAQAAYHYRHPESEVTAEPYELYEGGYINEALDSLGLRR